MKRLKKWGAMLLTTGMILNLTACSQPKDETKATQQAAGQKEQESEANNQSQTQNQETSGSGEEMVSLKLFYWDATFGEEIDELIKAYGAQEGTSNVTIEPTQLPWAEYWTKLETTLATGDDAPDIFWVNLAHLVEYLPAGYMLPLEDGVVDLEQYSATAMDLLKGEDGKHYGVPFLLDPNVLIYNKAMFDEAGLSYPTNDWTWDDFREAAKALTKEDGSQYGYCFRTDTGQGSMHEWLVMAGNNEFDYVNSVPLFAQDDALEGWSFVYDMMYQDKSTPTGAQMTEIQGDTYFQSGQAAMVFGAPPRIVANAEALGADKIGVSMLPTGSRRACSFSVCSMAGYANTKFAPQVQSFLKFTASEEGMKILSKAGLTARMDCFDVYEQNLGIDAGAIKESLEQSTLVPILYSVGHNSEFQTAFNSCIGEVFLTTDLDKDGIKKIVQSYADQCTALTQ